MARRALLLFPASSYRPDAYVAAAERLGIELVLATDMLAAARRFDAPCYRVDFGDIEASLAALADIAPLDGVLAVDERSASLAAWVAAGDRCRGGYHSIAGVQAAADKRLMRQRLLVAGERVPEFVVVPPATPVQAIADNPAVRYPCVVKPPMLSGSQGVIRADEPDALARAVARVRRVLARHPSPLSSQPGFFDLLLEDYVAGDEVAVEGLMCAGELQLLALFDKPDALEGPYFEETLYVTPSRKPAPLQRQLAAAAQSAARALGLDDGPIHAELRVDADGPVLIEIAARSIGGLCSRALCHQLGSLEERLLGHALGLAAEPLPASPPASGVMMLPVPRSGVLRGVTGVERARAQAGVDAVEIAIDLGETVRAVPDGASYLGFVFAHGPTPEEVERSLRAAHRALDFDLRPLLTVL